MYDMELSCLAFFVTLKSPKVFPFLTANSEMADFKAVFTGENIRNL